MQTKSAARNIFYGGSIFFLILLILLVANSHNYIVTKSTVAEPLSESVVRGKRLWEKNGCVNCHTIIGEGAYYAPELGDACTRFGGREGGAIDNLAAFIKAQPSGVEGRRQMPNFHLTDEELKDLSEFLCWTDAIDTQGWPPRGEAQ